MPPDEWWTSQKLRPTLTETEGIQCNIKKLLHEHTDVSKVKQEQWCGLKGVSWSLLVRGHIFNINKIKSRWSLGLYIHTLCSGQYRVCSRSHCASPLKLIASMLLCLPIIKPIFDGPQQPEIDQRCEMHGLWTRLWKDKIMNHLLFTKESIGWTFLAPAIRFTFLSPGSKNNPKCRCNRGAIHTSKYSTLKLTCQALLRNKTCPR